MLSLSRPTLTGRTISLFGLGESKNHVLFGDIAERVAIFVFVFVWVEIVNLHVIHLGRTGSWGKVPPIRLCNGRW
jgi:hypothetical protein